MNNFQLERMKFASYSLIRYLSMIASFCITIMMLKLFSTEEFVTFQTVLSCFVILYWTIDLGTIDLVILSKNEPLLIRKYASGRIFRFFLFTGVVAFATYFIFDFLTSLIMAAIALDYYNDSMIAFRTVRNSIKYLSLTLFVRKIPILVFLILVGKYDVKDGFVLLIILIIVSNLPWLIIDVIRFPFSYKEIFYFDNRSKLNTMQQGGNFLINLDIPLLNFISFPSIIPLFVLGRRLLQAGSIFGQFQIPQLLDADLKFLKLSNLRIRIIKNFFYTFIFCLFIILLFEFVSINSNYLQFSVSDRFLIYGSLLVSSLSVVTSQQNALLKALNEFRILCYSTFSSTAFYLISIYFFLNISGERWMFLFALLVNFVVELAFQELGFKRRHS